MPRFTILVCANIPLKMRLILSNPQSYVLSNSIHKSIKTIFCIQNIFFINPIKNLNMYGNEGDQVTSRRKRQLKFQMYKKKQFHALFFSILSPQLFLFLSLFSLIAIWRFTFQNVSNFFYYYFIFFYDTRCCCFW